MPPSNSRASVRYAGSRLCSNLWNSDERPCCRPDPFGRHCACHSYVAVSTVRHTEHVDGADLDRRRQVLCCKVRLRLQRLFDSDGAAAVLGTHLRRRAHLWRRRRLPPEGRRDRLRQAPGRTARRPHPGEGAVCFISMAGPSPASRPFPAPTTAALSPLVPRSAGASGSPTGRATRRSIASRPASTTTPRNIAFPPATTS